MEKALRRAENRPPIVTIYYSVHWYTTSQESADEIIDCLRCMNRDVVVYTQYKLASIKPGEMFQAYSIYIYDRYKEFVNLCKNIHNVKTC